MRWRRSRALRRLQRAERRLDLLISLGAQQRLLVQQLERQVHPLLETAPPQPEALYLPPVMEQALETPVPEPGPEPVTEPEPEPESTTILHPEEEPMEPPEQVIARLLGLPPRPTMSQDSPI